MLKTAVCTISTLWGVPPWMVWGIIQVESGGRPRVVNVNQNGTKDYGLMQINSFWVRRLFLDERKLLEDPEYNLFWGTYILRTCMDRYPDNPSRALGCYHTSRTTRQVWYASRVIKEGFGFSCE